MKRLSLCRSFGFAVLLTSALVVESFATIGNAAEPAGKELKAGKGKKNPSDGPVSDAKAPAKPALNNAAGTSQAGAQAEPAKKRKLKGRAIDLMTPPLSDSKATAPDGKKGAGKKGKKGATPAGDPNEITTLRESYNTLALADHDYKGHRHLAMHHLDRAANLLGADFNGDGKAGEPQRLSDAQLLGVKLILEKARGSIAAKGNAKVLEQVDAAIHEIGIALTIR